MTSDRLVTFDRCVIYCDPAIEGEDRTVVGVFDDVADVAGPMWFETDDVLEMVIGADGVFRAV